MARVYVGVGSNVDPKVNICLGIEALREAFGALIISPVYESKAIGFEGDNFYNLVIGFDTALDPQTFARQLHEIEFRHGRMPDAPRFSPRTLDLDLLLYDDLVLHQGGLELPRKEVTEYAFVLRPLAEIAGDLRHPVTEQRLRDLWQSFDQVAQPLWPVAPFFESE